MHIHGSHSHNEQKPIDPHYSYEHHETGMLRSFFRLKSFSIGVMHGLAGSAAVMIAILPTSQSFFTGFLFLILFSIGTMAAMCIMTIVIALPFSKSENESPNNASKVISIVAGSLSIIFGFALGSDLLLDTSFIWY